MPAVARRYRWLLFAILTIGLCLRLATVSFGLPGLKDPDELMFELGAVRMLRGPTLDPGWFGHPATTTMYLLAVIDARVFLFGYLTGHFASPNQFAEAIYADPSWVILPGRVAMVLFALGTIWLCWRLTTRFFGPRAGLAAALLLAFNPVHLTWSQIIRSDMMACFFMLLCLEACCDIAERGRWRDFGRAALWLGLAVATKWPFALTGIAIPFASLILLRSDVLPPRTVLLRLIASAPTAIAFLLLTSPYLLIDYPTVLRNLQGEGQAYHLGASGGGFWHNLWWYLSGPFTSAFGPAGLALAALGAVRLPRNRQALAILAPVAIAFVLLLSSQRLVWERWAVPLLPIGAILAGLGFVTLEAWLRRRVPQHGHRVVLVALVALATLLPLGWRIWSDGNERMHDTRQIAAAWALRNIPAGKVLLVEHFAFDMLAHRWGFLFPMGDAGCIDARALLRGKTGYAAVEKARAGRSNVDYGTIASSKAATCRADFAVLTQYERYRAERATFPAEYATYRRLLARGTVIATIAPQPHRSGGPIVTIVDLRPPLPSPIAP
jgi:hypothetical protein